MVFIVGTGHTVFGRQPEVPFKELIRTAALEALTDANLAPEEIDAAVLGHYNGGLLDIGFTGPLLVDIFPELRFKPTERLESACASGSSAVYTAIRMIRAGEAKAVLVVGAEKMSGLPTREIGKLLLKASHLSESESIQGGFAGVFAAAAEAYEAKYQSPYDAMARIAHKNHANGVNNPLAHLQWSKELTFFSEASNENPTVVGNMRRSDCSPISDGAAAVVVVDKDLAQKAKKSVHFRANAQATEFPSVSEKDLTFFAGCASAWSKALSQAQMQLDDLDLVETHDCFTIAELIQYESMGLVERGQGHRALDEGWVYPDGRLPVNLSGGLKAKGHPLGATGVSMHAMAARQLFQEAGLSQKAGAGIAGVFNMGGVAVSNYCSILERVA